MTRVIPGLVRSGLETSPRYFAGEQDDCPKPGGKISVILSVIIILSLMKLTLLSHPQEDTCFDGYQESR